MTSTVLLWVNEVAPYLDAIETNGLTSQVDLQTVRVEETPAADLLSRCEAMLAWRCPPGLLLKAPRLRWIQALTVGVEQWLALPDLPPKVILTCARGTHQIQMPENILGALFLVTRQFPTILADQRERRWTQRVSEPLAGKTLGILGLGTIGREVALKAAALGLKVIGTKRTPGEVPAVERAYPPEGIEEVLATSDFVLLLLPATSETRGIVNRRMLTLMKPSAWLLNFARGDLIVDADLVEAVKGERIAGAVLDVFREEPLPPGHPFWTTPGIIVLPHIGGLHPERDHFVARLFADNLERFLSGQPLRHVVFRERGY
jgi:phosphoglycerate dehydrogenase-like enzyme